MTALAVAMWGYSLPEIVIGILIIVGVLVIGYLVLTKGMGITIPDWVRQVFWVVLAVFIGVIAIKILVSM